MTQADTQQQQVQLRFDESKMENAYANAVRTEMLTDELLLDFGLNRAQQGQDGQQAMIFSVQSRVIVNWKAAKRLLGSLHQAVSAYEARFGEIDTNPPKPLDQANNS